MARNDREAHPSRVESARGDVEVGAADAGSDAADANVAGARSVSTSRSSTAFGFSITMARMGEFPPSATAEIEPFAATAATRFVACSRYADEA